MTNFVLYLIISIFICLSTHEKTYAQNNEKNWYDDYKPVDIKEIEADKAYGKGDYKSAFASYNELANDGHSHAQLMLGIMYLDGNGTVQNYELAKLWINKSAENNLTDAQDLLGYLYWDGKQFSKNFELALNWFKLGAANESAFAQYILGKMYQTGDGVKENKILAHMWYNIASANRSELYFSNKQKLSIEIAQALRNDIEKKMTLEEIIKAQNFAMICIERKYKNCDF
jgi:TPR repeat protein